MEAFAEESNFDRLVDVLRRRWPWIVICVVLAGGVAFAYSKHQTRSFTATAAVLFSNNQLSQQLAGLQTGLVGQAQPGNDERLVRVSDTAETTARALGRGLTASKVAESLSIAQQGETNVEGESTIVEVSASNADPELAADIANTYAEQFVARQGRVNRRYFDAALAIVERQLASLPADQRTGTARETLETRAQSLRLLAGLQYGGVEVAERAVVPTEPSSPRTKRNVGIGLVLGLLVGVALVLLLERLDRRVRRPRDLEELYKAPLLGLVPGGTTAVSPAGLSDDDAFALILAHLRAFNPDRSVRSVLITSAAPGDGKTTVAVHLAAASARSGARTLLLEVDFRNPGLAHQLTIPSTPGLLNVLNGTCDLYAAVQSIPVADSHDASTGAVSLDVLPCGSHQSPALVKLLASNTMDTLWERVVSEYDLLVIDSSSLTAVADAFAILQKVDGVTIVDALGRHPRDAAEQLHTVLARSTVPTLGIIANYCPSRHRAADKTPANPAQHHPDPSPLPS